MLSPIDDRSTCVAEAVTLHKSFKLVVWVGILLNWSFAAWAFVDPDRLFAMLGLGPVHDVVWLFNYSVLLAILSCFYIPAAKDPLRYRTNAWLMIVGRLVPATTFFVGVFVGFMPRGFLKLGAGDATIGVTVLVLLRMLRQRGALAETFSDRNS
jgi:hypothetical protein